MMRIRNHSHHGFLLTLWVFLLLILFAVAARSEEAGTAFSLSVPKEVKGYTHCESRCNPPQQEKCSSRSMTA